MLISGIFAGATTLGNVMDWYSKRTNEDDLNDWFDFLKSGRAKVKIKRDETDSMLGTAATAAFVGLAALGLLKGKNLFSLFKPNKTGQLLKNMSSKQKRNFYANALQEAQHSSSTWAGAGNMFASNLALSSLLELGNYSSTGEFSVTNVAQDTFKMTAGQAAGSALLGGAATFVAARFGMRDPAKVIDIAKRIGGFTGIIAVNAPGLIDMSSQTAEAASLDNEYDQGQNQYERMKAQLIPVPVQDSSTSNKQMELDEFSAKRIIDKHTGIDIMKHDSQIAEASDFAQSKAFADAAMELGLSNIEFESMISM
jgi:hypothetical protein